VCTLGKTTVPRTAPDRDFLIWFYALTYLALQIRPYLGSWRQADHADTAWTHMSWLIMVPLIAVTFICAAVPTFGT
jgi:hypothetical protein